MNQYNIYSIYIYIFVLIFFLYIVYSGTIERVRLYTNSWVEIAPRVQETFVLLQKLDSAYSAETPPERWSIARRNLVYDL